MRRFRIETDASGSVRVPSDRYFGVATQRATQTPGVPGLRLPRRFRWALGLVKRSFCEANEAFELLDVARAEWIATAAQEVMDGRLDADFPLDVLQDGTGIATHDNADEVIANRAIELMGGELGSRDPVHPAKHVGLHQSALEVVAAAAQIAAAVAIEQDLLPALEAFEASPAGLPGAAARASQARDSLLGLDLGDPSHEAPGSRTRSLTEEAIDRIADEADLAFREVRHTEPGEALAGASRHLATLAGALLGEASPALSTLPSLQSACAQVLGSDLAIHLGAPDARPRKMAALPLVAHNLLQGTALLASALQRAAQAHAADSPPR